MIELREVVMQPWGISAVAPIAITMPDGSTQLASLCSAASCALSEIELRGFPEGAFYEARETSEIERIPYVGDETITWSTRRRRSAPDSSGRWSRSDSSISIRPRRCRSRR